MMSVFGVFDDFTLAEVKATRTPLLAVKFELSPDSTEQISGMVLSRQSLEQASRLLAELDQDWRRLIDQVGQCTLQVQAQREPYEALVKAVAYQQLHGRAADAILGRLTDQYAGRIPSAEELLNHDFDNLRLCGFSARKIETLRTIAGAAQTGQIPTRKQALRMSDEKLIERLVSLKGIGRWTVEMLLIFALGREDILPVDDYGVRDGYRRLKRLETAPTPKQLQQIGYAWSPYRTVASWYLWRVPK